MLSISCVLGHLAAAFLEWHALDLVIAYSVHRNLVALASATELHSEAVSDIHTNAGNLSSEQAISAEASPRSSDRQPGSTVRYLPFILLPEDRTESLDQSFKKVNRVLRDRTVRESTVCLVYSSKDSIYRFV